MFICFVGIDGAGKSTLAQALVAELKKRGIKSEYVYSRFRPLILRPVSAIGRALFLRGKDINKDYLDYSNAKKTLFKNRLLSLVYEYLLLFDYFFQVIFKVKAPLVLGKNVVCDRYVYDTIITDLAVDIGYSKEKIKKVLKFYLRLLPKPDVVFFVDVPEEIACERKGDIPCIDYLKERRGIYLEIGREYGVPILNGSKDLTSLESEIVNEVFR